MIYSKPLSVLHWVILSFPKKKIPYILRKAAWAVPCLVTIFQSYFWQCGLSFPQKCHHLKAFPSFQKVETWVSRPLGQAPLQALSPDQPEKVSWKTEQVSWWSTKRRGLSVHSPYPVTIISSFHSTGGKKFWTVYERWKWTLLQRSAAQGIPNDLELVKRKQIFFTVKL